MRTKALLIACIISSCLLPQTAYSTDYEVYVELSNNEVSEENRSAAWGVNFFLSDDMSINLGYKDYIKVNEAFQGTDIEFDYSVVSAALEYEFLHFDRATAFASIGAEYSLSEVTANQGNTRFELLKDGDTASFATLGLKFPLTEHVGLRTGVSYTNDNGLAPESKAVFLGIYGYFGGEPDRLRTKTRVKPADKASATRLIPASTQQKPTVRQSSPQPKAAKPVVTPAKPTAEPQQERANSTKAVLAQLPPRSELKPSVCLQVGSYREMKNAEDMHNKASKANIRTVTTKSEDGAYRVVATYTRETAASGKAKLYNALGIRSFSVDCPH